MDTDDGLPTGAGWHRRRMLAVLGTTGTGVLAAGCATYGATGGAPAAPPPPAADGRAGTSAPGTPAPDDAGADIPEAVPLAQVADVPVGGGLILGDRGVVLTQPAAGTIRAFSVVCTHQGCPVSEVAGGEIICRCHNSRFAVADGAVVGGPASGPLSEVAVTVDGATITLG